MGGRGGGDLNGAWFIVIPIIIVAVIVATYFQVALMFAIPLAADLQLGPISASLISLRAVNIHFWWVLLLLVLVGLMVLAGFVALIIGVFFVLPLAWLATMLLYEEIFAPREARITAPQEVTVVGPV
jgi:uncharacterized membrane protein